MSIAPALLMALTLPLGSPSPEAQEGTNPFFREYDTPFKAPPFHLIRNEHFRPAFQRGVEEQRREIEAIAGAAAPPTFANTIEALDRSGDLLRNVGAVFNSLRAANTNDTIQRIANDVTPLLTKHSNDITLNDLLFRRVKAVFDRRDSAGLTSEQKKLAEDTYYSFVRGGASVPPEKKARYRQISEELSMLSLKFDENVLEETNRFRLVVERAADLAGLPQQAIDAAAEAAARDGMKGKWVFTVKKPSMIPFLQYAANRSLRERLYTAYIMRGDNGGEHDNTGIASRIAVLRVELAQLLGYPTYAAFSLDRTMAKKPQAVYDFLQKLWDPALRNAQREREALQALIKEEGGTFALRPWDWWYYAEKERRKKYDLDENELRPYFVMENVRQGAFDLATTLFGIRFIERKDVPTYADDVAVFEVREDNGTHVGLLYTDYFPRPGKQAGAWCDGYRSQERRGDSMVTPLVYNVGNFSRPAAGQPSLLSPDEVRTLFHEFGHALNGLLSNTTYRGLTVPGDFVELPSQIMENWAFEPEMLKRYARHYRSGELMPQALAEKIVRSSTFNQGFITTEYLAACFLDMDWHMLADSSLQDAHALEKRSMERIRLIPEIAPRYRTPYFLHSFSGGYSAGYYYYIWAAVLDADAFEAFKEKGLFDRATATAFREFVLARGAADDAMKQYVRFRGKEPSTVPLLKRRGLL